MDASVVARLLEQTARAVYDARGPRAIHAGQWAVLRYLARAGRQARTVGGVATYLGVTHAPASRAVSSLARKDLVTVRADPEDRRVRRIDLTAAGRALLDHDPVHRLTAAIEGLSSDKQKELAITLEALYGRLSKAS
ncbi:MAG: MarR family transcriptional regulator [Hyphomicrobiales bacterium]|jgi:DNA-binding MarR family transcriptional regulator|nr:MarR family transcriptional regulator [Hyphomicrobiales bacterium]